MKRISLLSAALFMIFAAASAFSQAPAQPGAGKIGWLDTTAFGDEKAGITKYINAIKAVETEMKPRVGDLQTLQTRLKTISDDLAKLQAACQNPAVPCDTKTAAAKQDEGQRLQREFDFKKKEFDAAYDKRSGEVLGPISSEIGKALQDYAKQKGYAAVLDISKLDQAGVILALDATADITKDFITFYNARPATTATTAVPK
jgi:Skp family chaperone for outer membrane proteins